MKTATEDPVLQQFLGAIEPFAASCREIRLFGSRARDDFRPDSDYDILITLDQKDSAIKSKLYDAVIDVLLATGKLISLKIYTVAEFDRLRLMLTPFTQNIVHEGISLGFNK